MSIPPDAWNEQPPEQPPEQAPRWVEYRAWVSALDQRDAVQRRAERADRELANLRASIAEVDHDHLVSMERVVRPVLREELLALARAIAATDAVTSRAPVWRFGALILGGILLWSSGWLCGAIGALP